MAIRRLFLGAAAAASLVTAVATATPSSAQPTYPPAGPSLSVSDSTVDVGDTITVAGTGLLPNSIVTITSFVSGPIALGPLTGTRTQADEGMVRARVVSAAFTGDGGRPPGGGHHFHHCSTGRTCRVPVDAEGDFSTPFTLTRLGITVIEVHGQDAAGDPATVSVTVRVEGAEGVGGPGNGGHGGHGGLAFTGTPVLGSLAAGLIMVIAGSGLMLGFRRKRRRAPTS